MRTQKNLKIILLGITSISLLLSVTTMTEYNINENLTLQDPIPLIHAKVKSIQGVPILVTNNTEFTSNGFTGYGNKTHPYVIENFNITDSSTNLIDIRDTTVHFIIRNCLLNGITGNIDGIYFSNVFNGTIDSNIIQYCSNCFHLLIPSKAVKTPSVKSSILFL